MKVICDRSALSEALGMIGGVAVSRTPTPVLSCVKLVANEGALWLSATDAEIGLRLGVGQVDIQKPGEALVPFDKLNQIVRACDDPTLSIEAEKTVVNIRGADSHFKVYGYDPKDFPKIRDFADLKVDFEVDAGHLRRLVQRTLFATAVENSRYAINGVLFERKGKKLRVVATDGRRLAVARGEVINAVEGEAKSIVPTKALNTLLKLIVDPAATVKVASDANQIIFAVGEGDDAAVLTSNLVQGAFPPFEDVIPKDQDKKVSFDSAELTSAVRRAALLTNEESKGVRLAFAENRLTLTSRAPEMGEAEIVVDMKSYQGEPIEIGFNPGYITDALKVIDSDQVMIELKAPNKPGVLKAGNDFTYVVMPVNLA
jgi:DNA polymerase III subunit beta